MKVRHIEGDYDDGNQNFVRNIESSLYPGFVIPREFVRSLLGKIKETRHSVCYTEKFVVGGVPHNFINCLKHCLTNRTFHKNSLWYNP